MRWVSGRDQHEADTTLPQEVFPPLLPAKLPQECEGGWGEGRPYPVSLSSLSLSSSGSQLRWYCSKGALWKSTGMSCYNNTDVAMDIYGTGPRMKHYLAMCKMAPYDKYLSFIPHTFQMFYGAFLSKSRTLLWFFTYESSIFCMFQLTLIFPGL